MSRPRRPAARRRPARPSSIRTPKKGQTVDWFLEHWRAVLVVAFYLGLVNQTGSFLVPAAAMGGTGAVWFAVRAVRRVRQMRRALPDSPWWRLWFDFAREEQGRAAIRAAWVKACEGQGLTSAKRTPGLYDLRRTPEGDFTATITSQAGVPVSKVIGRTQELAEVMRFREVVVTPRAEGRGTIEFRRSNPLARTVLPGGLKRPPKGHIALGVRNDGQVASLRVLDGKGKSVFTPMLVGAVTGGGKSGFLHALVGGLIAAEIPTRLWVFDPKGGVELGAYEEWAGQPTGNPLFSVARYVSDPGEATAMLKEMNGARIERLSRQRKRDHAPTVDEPLELFVCDEFFGLQKSQTEKGSAHHYILSQGRASGFSVVCLTQLTEKENIGPLRESFDQRVTLRTRTAEQTVAVLGTREAATLAPAHLIAKNTPGVFYMDSDGDVIKGRVAWYDDDAIGRIAQGLLPRGARVVEPERRCSVYRFYSWDRVLQAKQLQYVGKAFDPAERYEQHAADARQDPHGKGRWWADVQRFRVMDNDNGQLEHFVVRWYPSEAEALEAEAAAIRAELPAQNVLHNRRNPIRARRLRVVRDEAVA